MINYGTDDKEALEKMSTLERIGPVLAAKATGAAITSAGMAVLGPVGMFAILVIATVAIVNGSQSETK